MKLAIDARMIHASGIGRYLRQVLAELRQLGVDDCALIGDPESLGAFCAPSWDVIPFSQGIYSPLQHLTYPLARHAAKAAYFPHIHVPWFTDVAEKIVVTIHDMFHLGPVSTLSVLEKRYLWLHYRRAIEAADLILPNSKFTWSETTRHFPAAARVAHEILYPCVEALDVGNSLPSENMHRILGMTRGKPRVLYVGNVKPHKNLHRLVEAFELPELSGFVLVVVGKREGFVKGVSLHAQRLLESERVIFTGQVPDSELCAWYRNCDLLVFPSLYEGFGYPPLESLSQGTPAAVSDLPVFREVCGEAVAYFDPYSVKSIAAAVRRTVEDPQLRSQTLARAAEILVRYCPERTARKQALAIASLL